ncbi:AraC family transcriptional regulator [Hydrogenophaga crassostreae]|uniref:AraC family transcriptional regulator n=1 Tax=Hydrogenophaga crassostreae TaxID=1763535 RepID=A0ABX2U8N7_9BURK|nr:AraC family transcriptional regulator [Hydrogenophaga crassostreae]
MLPSGAMWQPRASLANCLRGVLVRSTLGADLDDAQRINHFPASPLCSLGWLFSGSSSVLSSPQGSPEQALAGERVPLSARWVLAGPQTQPTATWSPGPAHGMMVMFMPDALHLLTGLEPVELIDQFVDASELLPLDWMAMCQQVQGAPEDAQRLAILENFLDPRWQACRPTLPLYAHRYADWALHLAQRAALSGPGRSARQLERRVKRWSGLPMRELRGLGRAEQAFFNVMAAQNEGPFSWADIATDNGYADQSHLCRTVRRITGFSPEALRQGIQRQESFWAYRVWM